MMDENMDMSFQYVLAAQKADHTLDCIKISVAIGSREAILALCSTLLEIPSRSHLEYCIQL